MRPREGKKDEGQQKHVLQKRVRPIISSCAAECGNADMRVHSSVFSLSRSVS